MNLHASICRAAHKRPSRSVPLLWLLMGYKAGDNTQVLALAEALDWPFETKKIIYRPTELLTNLLLGPTLAGVQQNNSSALVPPWPDLVITAGRRNEPVARWIKAHSRGHTRLVHLGRPWADPKHFDLIVTTPQYAVPPGPNVLRNTLPLHRLSNQRLDQARRVWKPRLIALPRPFTVILLGGNSGPYTFTPDRAQQLAAAVNQLAQHTGGALLITSSARTPQDTLTAFRNNLLVMHHFHEWKPNDSDNPYFGYLAVADAIVVTGESVSMLTEACVTGKPVYIYDLGDHPIPLPVHADSEHLIRPKRTPWWRYKEHYRWKPLSHRLAMALGPRRMRRDVGMIHQHLIQNGRAVWLGESFPRKNSPPPLEDLTRAMARVHELFPTV